MYVFADSSTLQKVALVSLLLPLTSSPLLLLPPSSSFHPLLLSSKGLRRLASGVGFALMIAAAIGCTLFSTPAMTTASLCLGWAGLAMHTFGYNVSNRVLLS